MAEPFLGEIRLFSFLFAPQGWALCNGASLPVSQNQALFSLLGIAYGGDGRTTFNLPDLRGRTPVDVGAVSGRSSYVLGGKAGSETVALTAATMPPHNHAVQAQNNVAAGNAVPVPTGNFPATVHRTDSTVNGHPLYGSAMPASGLVALNPATIADSAAGVGHDNMQQFGVLNFCIAVTGYYPPRG